MESTSPSLLERLREPHDADAWGQFVHLYTPLLVCWAKRFRLGDADVADLVQEVFVLLLEKLPEFRYDRSGRFRGWLWTVASNKYRERLRRRQLPTQPGADDAVDPASLDDPDEAEYRRYLARRALSSLRDRGAPQLQIPLRVVPQRG